jgi:hypothetical protein
MKILLLGSFAVVAFSPLASANFSERKLESAMASATKNRKLIALIFYQDYALPQLRTRPPHHHHQRQIRGSHHPT